MKYQATIQAVVTVEADSFIDVYKQLRDVETVKNLITVPVAIVAVSPVIEGVSHESAH